ncbi:DUF4232 domain-containing protein [Streptomyces sp. MS19]|uniref:DUF4232 domain-containing protein n=1 Tax=Streptomyces sp. MS19 TaxID=3385972 RepID=UPI00399FB674
MTSPHDPHDDPPAAAGGGEPSGLDGLFAAPVTPLPPPAGAFATVRRRAAARRRRRVVAAGAATAVCVAGATAVVALTRPGGPPPVSAPPVSRSSVPADEDPSERGSPSRAEAPSGTGEPSVEASGTGPASSDPAPEPSGGGAGRETAASPGASGVCGSDQLDLAVAATEGAAGSVYLTLRFTNTGDAACTMTGFPGVSLVAGDGGEQIGAPAERAATDGAPVPVELAPDGSAVTDLRVTQAANHPAEDCDPTPARGLRVYPPDERSALYLPDDALTGCADEGVSLLSVAPVRAEDGS